MLCEQSNMPFCCPQSRLELHQAQALCTYGGRGCSRDESGSCIEGTLGKLWGALCRNLTATAACSNFILEEVLAPSDADPSAGFSLHIADILVQELSSACEDSPVPAPALQVRSEFSRGSARAHKVLIVECQERCIYFSYKGEVLINTAV